MCSFWSTPISGKRISSAAELAALFPHAEIQGKGLLATEEEHADDMAKLLGRIFK